MAEHQMTVSEAGAVPEVLDVGAILKGPFRDPRAVSKFIGGCFAVICIPVLGLGLLALLGFRFQTAQRARAGEEHPMPGWMGIGGLIADGVRVLSVRLVYFLPVLALAFGADIFDGIPFVGELMKYVSKAPQALALATVLIPIALIRMVASNKIRSAFRFHKCLQLVQAHVGTYVVLLMIWTLIHFVGLASVALFGIGLIPGLFWSFAAEGIALGRAARAMEV